MLNRAEIEAQAADKYPGAVVEFRSWLTSDFISNPQSSQPEWAGVRTAIFGSLLQDCVDSRWNWRFFTVLFVGS